MNRYTVTLRLVDANRLIERGSDEKSWEARVEVERQDGAVAEIEVCCEVVTRASDIEDALPPASTARVVARFDRKPTAFDEPRYAAGAAA